MSPRLRTYRWHADQRVRGLRVFHGLAHCALLRENARGSEGDAWLLTVDLCVPPSLVTRSDAETVALVQRHTPVWLVDLAFLADSPRLRVDW